MAIKKGDKGILVKKLQERLNEIGYNCGSVDGIFGTNTENAVKKLQKDYNLNVDGIVGYYTCLLYTSPSPRD